MMKKYLGLLCAVLLLWACGEDGMEDRPAGTEEVRISAMIGTGGLLSKAVTGIDGKGRFEEGDVLTLKYGEVRTDLTLEGGAWVPAPDWEAVGGDGCFSGFYPAVSESGSTFTHTVAVDQRPGKAFEESDLLHAGPVVVPYGQPVELDFRHLMSCLTVKLVSNVYTAAQLEGATVKVKGYTAIDVEPDGSLGALHDYDYKHQKNMMSDIVLKHKGDGVFQAVMCPQDVHKWAYSEWWLSISVPGEEGRVFTVVEPPAGNPVQEFSGFQAGKNHTLTYTFNRKGKDPVFGGKTVWVDGLQHMPDPASDAWKVYHQDQNCTLKHLPWDPSYGWYDMNKKDRNAASPVNDKNYCWAATSSNMIHWWLDRNRGNVDRFCLENQIPEGQIPQKCTDRHTSEVFDIFKQCFENEAGYIKEGLNWYFFGEYDSNGGVGAELQVPGSGGYFKDVFNAKSGLVSYRGIGTMADLSAALKDAFTAKRAIGFEIKTETLEKGHAMTIWGATFDEYGVATAIYYVDNDDGEKADPGPHKGLMAARVGVYEGQKQGFVGRACMINSVGQARIAIDGLILLDQGTEGWSAYFKHPAGHQ